MKWTANIAETRVSLTISHQPQGLSQKENILHFVFLGNSQRDVLCHRNRLKIRACDYFFHGAQTKTKREATRQRPRRKRKTTTEKNGMRERPRMFCRSNEISDKSCSNYLIMIVRYLFQVQNLNVMQ